MKELDMPEQYKELNDKLCVEIMERAEKLWPILSELGCKKYQCFGDGIKVTIERCKNDC
jgi:hypothetical protein